MNPQDLPVYKHKAKILEALAANQVIVVESPTGSGKTTQLPIILHEAGYADRGLVGVTQPRRIAAVSVSSFIQNQVGKAYPELVGYKMRFDDRTTRNTKIKIMTDGILLQELKLDWSLSQYSVIMVDEAHERSLNIDFVLGLLKRVLDQRPDFKVIVSSATINAEVFSQYFNSCPVVRIDTDTYPVTTVYAPPARDDDEVLLAKIFDLVGHILEEKREGDILIFLPGEKVIKDCIAGLNSQPYKRKLELIPLYGRLSKEEQDAVFPAASWGKIKVIVSTNIAETSLTIDGVTSVIDSGQSKINFYNPRTYTSSLIEKPISRASANQRRGRAGRTRPGTCYRLYTKEDFESRPLFTQEEIYRTDLSEVVLRMAELEIRNFNSFDFISSPGKAGIDGAIESLLLLDALNPDNSLSDIGKMMALFPLLPRHSRILVEAIRNYPDIMEEALIATSFLSTDTPFILPQGEELEARKAHHAFRDPDGDFVSYIRLYRAFVESDKKAKFCERYYVDLQSMSELVNVKDQLEQIVSSQGVPISHGGPVADLICSIAKGLMQFICFRLQRGYQSLTGEKVDIHPGSGLWKETPRYIVAGEIVRTSRMYARSVSPIRKEWLTRISPELARYLLDEKAAQRLGKITLAMLSRGPAAKAKPGPKALPQSGKTAETVEAEAGGAYTVVLFGRLFPLQHFKGKKKLLQLTWDDVTWLLAQPADGLSPMHGGLRTIVEYEKNRFLEGEKLGRALAICRHLKLPADLIGPPAAKSKLSIWDNLDRLEATVGDILKLAKVAKGGVLGFVTLYTNQEGMFWLKPIIGFTTALTESFASLEYLADAIDAAEHPRLVATIGSHYRRLAEILESV